MESQTLDETKPSGDGSPPAEDKQEEPADGGDGEEEKKDGEVEVKEDEKPKRGRKRGSVEKGREDGTAKMKEKRRRSAAREGVAPVERPSRERKAVERFSDMSPQRTPVTKVLSFKQGSGKKLKDIPNVLFKVSKRKADESLQVLHTTLFGRRSNAHFLKRNILQFSGFVWTGNEEKHRARVKEKLDKFNKEKLLDFCDLLDIHVVKTTTRKEEVTAKLLEFLESPCVTRDVVLAEKMEKGKKKRRQKGTSPTLPDGGSAGRQTKRQKNSSQQVAEEEDNDEAGAVETKDASTDGEYNDNLSDKSEQEDEEEVDEPGSTNGGSDNKQMKQIAELSEIKQTVSPTGSAPSNKRQLKSSPNKVEAQDEPSSQQENKKDSAKELTKKGSKALTKEKSAANKQDSAKVTKHTSESSTRKNVTAGNNKSGSKSTYKGIKGSKKKSQPIEIPAKKNKSDKSEPKFSTKKQRGKNKASEDTYTGPSTEELHAVASDILKEVDFNTATLADILRQLEDHFNIDLMDRKAEIRGIIEDIINSMPGYDVDDDDEGGSDDADDDNGAEHAEDGAKNESDGDGDN